MNPPFGLGAHESPFDNRTYRHDLGTMAGPLVKGGVLYLPEDIENQSSVGICTAISLTQNAGKARGKKYSADFQYLLQKKFYDGAWFEGSSIFNALKVGKKYGFLPAELWTWTTIEDRMRGYDWYVAKLKAVPDEEVARLITLCIDRLSGYAQVPTDPQSLAKGIMDSKSGLLCRYDVGNEWWTARDGRPSWSKSDIDPLRRPQQIVSGHAIGSTYFDFSVVYNIEHPNTWGTSWNDDGKGHTIHDQYPCTEAWIPYYDAMPDPVPPSFIFTHDMQYGERSNDVRELQKRLGVSSVTGYYGDLTRSAVLDFQIMNNVPLSLYERWFIRGGRVGPKTRDVLNRS